MGFYRLFLAALVLASHVHYRGWDFGESAVICFLLISGFVMTKLIDAHYSDSGKTLYFYVDRAARIFPQYLFYCAATLILMACVDLRNGWVSGCTPSMVAGNIFLYGLYDANGAPTYLCTLIPPAWSLSLEWAFYLVIPFIVNARSRVIFACVAAYSISIYLKAYLGVIDTEWFGYRHLPGTLFIFLTGVAYARNGAFWVLYRRAVWIGSVALLIGFYASPHLLELHSNLEVVVGLVAGLPILHFAIKAKPGKLESFAGNISYGVFLNHFFLILILDRFTTWTIHLNIPARLAVLMPLSFALSALTFRYIESPIMRWRRRLRKVREDGVLRDQRMGVESPRAPEKAGESQSQMIA